MPVNVLPVLEIIEKFEPDLVLDPLEVADPHSQVIRLLFRDIEMLHAGSALADMVRWHWQG